MSKMVFVFGSNLAGIHGAGAAKYALMQEGAVWGIGEGAAGNSYGIPTKDRKIMTLPITEVEWYVKRFIAYAESHLNQDFKVTRIGCGLAGFTDADIAPFFRGAPANCFFDSAWEPYFLVVKEIRQYWGTM